MLIKYVWYLGQQEVLTYWRENFRTKKGYPGTTFPPNVNGCRQTVTMFRLFNNMDNKLGSKMYRDRDSGSTVLI